MAGKQFYINQLDQKRFIRVNDSTKEVTNPALFNSTNGPTPDGLLSNTLFGITKAERSGIYGYIDLKEKFINPYFYKIWQKIDKNLRGCVYETETYIIDKQGYLEQSDQGETGIKFLVKNIDRLRFKDTKQKHFVDALLEGAKSGLFFTDKLIITPPFYRDVDTSKGGRVGVGEVNKLYISILNKVKALNDANDYGFDIKGGIRGQIQDMMLELYNWFTLGESTVGGEHTGSGIFKKLGVMRRTVMAKTADYSNRLVLTEANVNVNSKEELMVDLDYSSIPLASALSTMYPFVIYNLHQWFNNEFGGKTHYSYMAKDGTIKQVELENIMVEFSDDRLDKEINEFIHGYSNRFKRIEVPNKEGLKLYCRFKGYSITREEYADGIRENDTIIDRDITWCDLFYIAACESAKDKYAIITRYPINELWHHTRKSVLN